MCPRTGGQPEIKGRVNQVHQFAVIEITAAIVDKTLTGFERAGGPVNLFVVFPG